MNSINKDAKDVLMRVATEHPTRSVSNYHALFELARRIADADNAKVKIDSTTIAEAAKNALGVA